MRNLDQPALFLISAKCMDRGRHRLVPFIVLEEGGRFGDHALALLSEIAEFGAQTRKLKVPESWASSSPIMMPLLTGCASGSRRSLDGFSSPCLLTLSFAARHLVPLCMGPNKLRTLGL